jgi:hypothetical protein
LIDGIESNGQRFADGSFRITEVICYRETTLFGHDDVFGKATIGLVWATQEPQFTAGMWPANPTLVAHTTWHGGLNGNPVARFDTGDRRTNCHHFTGTFMPYREGIVHHLATDLSIGIVDIRAANADYLHPDKYIGFCCDLWHGEFE